MTNTKARPSKLSFGLGEDTPEIDVVMRSNKFRDLRAQLEALHEQPHGTPLRIDVQLHEQGTQDVTIQDEVKAIQNAVYGWARARQLEQRGLHVTAAKKIVSESTAVVRVEINAEDSSTADSAADNEHATAAA